MIIVMPILAVIYFLLFFYPKLRYGQNYISWPPIVFVIVYIVIAGMFNLIDNFTLVILPILLTPWFAWLLAFIVLRKRAGKRVLTYKRHPRSVPITISLVLVILLLTYFATMPRNRYYPDGEPVYDDRYYQQQLPMGVIFGLLGFGYFLTVFRKGEIFENGIATPDLQFLSWFNYEAYEWSENTNRKNGRNYQLVFKREKSASVVVHEFSESTKNILDEILKRKFPDQNSSS